MLTEKVDPDTCRHLPRDTPFAGYITVCVHCGCTLRILGKGKVNKSKKQRRKEKALAKGELTSG